MKSRIKIKTADEIKIMQEGGRILADVKARLESEVKEGVNAEYIDKLAEDLILKLGAKPSFKMVKGYYWTTCVNLNEGVVHGIPKKEVVFRKGDIVSVDVGVFFRGFHTDTSFSKGIEMDANKLSFLKVGKYALNKAINEAKVGNYVYDISYAIESSLTENNLNPIKGLVGHGVGRELHEDPQIPCLVYQKRNETEVFLEGNVIAIEVMYTTGSGDIMLMDDGWTISTKDGKISALFEDTICITNNGPLILTD
jgi:methionyl aminopeptidase